MPTPDQTQREIDATAALYDSTRQQLAAQLTGALASQIDTLALVVVGIEQSVSETDTR